MLNITGDDPSPLGWRRCRFEGVSRDDDAIATAIQDGGHTFVQFTFPTADETFTYDIATNAWFQTGLNFDLLFAIASE
jgi:hypothetical protein